ncbi:hypothetical protein ACFW9M_06690 [Streptomyces lydicus]|uniref:hypothetical protein n=1 Tax=Streptomyces lydicus TaxID=47763 RepID=UPI00369051A4
MLQTIGTIFEGILGRLLPARGRHRVDDTRPAASREDVPTLVLPRVPFGQLGLLRGEDTALIRPYVLTTEERLERRLQRGHHQVLWFTAHGVDTGPRWIHGAGVTA